MYFSEENNSVIESVLLIFSPQVCWRQHIPMSVEGTVYRVLLEADVLGIPEDFEIELYCSNKQWHFNYQRIIMGIPFTLTTKQSERLLLILCQSANDIAPVGRLHLQSGESIRIGKAFPNAILYNLDSRIESCHAIIKMEEQDCVMESRSVKGIYVNGKAAQAKHALRSGDWIDIYGLHLLLAKGWIICTAFCGICRVAENKQVMEFGKGSAEISSIRSDHWIERRYEEEGLLHMENFEILLPTQTAKKQGSQLLLTLGPSLTMVMPTMLMVILGSTVVGNTRGSFFYLTAVMTVCSSFLAVFWGLVNHIYKKNAWRTDEKNRRRQYREYLEHVQTYLENCRKDNQKVLNQRYPPCFLTMGSEEKSPTVMWNRYYMNKDFLFLRMGTGSIPFQMKVKLNERQKQIVFEKMIEEAKKVEEKFSFVEQAPIGIDFFATRRMGVISAAERSKVFECLMVLLVQIAMCHCYNEVKVVCFYNYTRSEEKAFADCIRWMSHNWSEDRKVRFLAGCEAQAAEILPTLIKEVETGAEKNEEKRVLPWFIFFVLDKSLIQGETIYQYLSEATGKYPVSTIFIGESKEQLPTSCRCYINCLKTTQEIVTYGQEQVCRQQMKVDTVGKQDVERYIRQLSGLRVKDASSNQIPSHVSFLELYDCRRIEDINSKCRWAKSKPEDRLKVPIGRGRGGSIISLDVHEKFHGPHGLIAGTTGSGKSELIQTYLMSMAVSYSPSDVTFFMIDYKGGGTGNVLKGLPHCAGVISNLSGSQIKRAMSAISSENKRRQRLLLKHQVNHIDAYTELYRDGRTQEPMPHLILVVDEFAELKKEEPEFMQEIISLAQVGRSLGVHLVLATQKPAGTVDDKIWSNARFRLCLRVQDRQDSMDMLHCGDAARLTTPGQCYLQIGNHEYYELFQTGYCGGTYQNKNIDSPKATMVSDTGKRITYKDTTSDEQGMEQMQVLIDYVCKTAAENNYVSIKSLWMPELPTHLSLIELERIGKCVDRSEVNKVVRFAIGLVDDPENQEQFSIEYAPASHGHLAICGGPSTGKSTLLQTILWQVCRCFSAEQIQYFLVDIGRGSLQCFAHMPQCISYFDSIRDRDIFFYHFQHLIEKRKEQLSGVNFRQYNMQSKKALPLLLLIIDGVSSLLQILNEQQMTFLHKLISEGVNYGIYFILTATGTGEIPGRMFEKLKTTIALELSDRFQYGDVLRQYPISVYPKDNIQGRGLCKMNGRVLELQVALLSKHLEDYDRLGVVKELEHELMNAPAGRGIIEKFPHIPKQLTVQFMYDEFQWELARNEIPMGYSLSTGELMTLSITTGCCLLISGAEQTGRKNMLCLIAEGILKQEKKLICIDIQHELSRLSDRKEITLLTEASEIEDWQYKQDETGCYEKACILIGDMTEFCSFLYGDGDSRKITFWEKLIKKRHMVNFMAAVFNPEKDKAASATAFFKEFVSNQQGVHLGGNVGNQRVLSFDDLSYSQLNQRERPGTALYKASRNAATQKLFYPEYQTQKTKGRLKNDTD